MAAKAERERLRHPARADDPDLPIAVLHHPALVARSNRSRHRGLIAAIRRIRGTAGPMGTPCAATLALGPVAGGDGKTGART